MNLLNYYQVKFEIFLKDLEKKKIIKLPNNLNSLKIELTPKNQKGDFACNAAMFLSKINNSSSVNFANFLKEKILQNFSEISSIEIAKPGFLNLTFNINFWNESLCKIIKLKKKYGSTDYNKKKN